MRAAAVVAIFAATAMAQTGHAGATGTGVGNGTATQTGKPTAPTNGASSLSQNILLGVGAVAVAAYNL